MTEIWPPEGARAHFRVVSMCRATLDTAVDTFATGSWRIWCPPLPRAIATRLVPLATLAAATMALDAPLDIRGRATSPKPGRERNDGKFGHPPRRVQTVEMDNSGTPPPDSPEGAGTTVFEHALPPDWRDVNYRRVGEHAQFVAAVIELAFSKAWAGSTRTEDMRLETTQLSGARDEKGFNDIAWSALLRPEWQDGSQEPRRIHVVIEAQWTVQPSMPFRVMQYEGMRYRLLQQGRKPAPRIQTIVLYTGDRPWDVSLEAGESIDAVQVDTLPRVHYEVVDLQRLEAGPGTQNIVALLAGVVRGETFEGLTCAVAALARRLAALGDVNLERDMFELVQAEGQVKWPDFDWQRSADLAGLVRRLKEAEMTWPEKWMTQMRPNWREEVNAELRAEQEPKMEAELQPKVEAKLRTELQPKVEAGLRTELVPKVEAGLRTELVPKVEADLRAELRAEVREELREEMRAEERGH